MRAPGGSVELARRPAPSFLARVSNAFAALRGRTTPDTTRTGFSDILSLFGGQAGIPWEVENSRLAIHRDIQRMIDTDPIIPAGFEVWADWITAPGADDPETLIINSEETRVQDVLKALDDRIGLSEQVWQFAHGLKAFGNEFVENVIGPVDGGLGIVELKELPEQQLFRQVDSRGNLGRDDKGQEVSPYVQRIAPLGYGGPSAVEFQRWQVTHFAARPLRPGGYGTAQMASARRLWKALQYTDTSLFIARIVRAYSRLAHHIPVPAGATQAQVQERIRDYKKGATRTDVVEWSGDQRLPSDMVEPLGVDRDWFMPLIFKADGTSIKGEIDLLDPKNDALTEIKDVEYAQNKLFVRLGVPKALLGLERDVNAKATLTEQGRQFARRVRAAQIAMVKGLKEICDLELLLNGMIPSEAEYDVEFPMVNVRDEETEAAVELVRAQVAKVLDELGAIDKDAVRSFYTRLTDEEIKDIEDRITSQPPPKPPPTPPPVVIPAVPEPSEGVRAWLESGEAAADLIVAKHVLENRFGIDFEPGDGEPD